MIIDKTDGCFHEAHMTFDDLQFIVCAANIAGYLEAKEKIYVDGDMRLTEFILNKFIHWFDEEWKDVSFNDYIADQLLDEFGFKED